MKNNITYKGNVTIKVKNKPNKKVNNNGTKSLFILLYDLLCGNIIHNTSNYLPIKIAMIHDNNGSIEVGDIESFDEVDQYSILLDELIITSRNVNIDRNSVCFSSVVAHNNFKNISKSIIESEDTSCYVLLLNNQGTKNILAYAAFEYNDIRAVLEDVNGQGVVEWEMFFDNKEGA